ncbi:MAG: helix-hairpin-helix domain-containing protein [Pirellulales bacterium]|nr:helix-hairpin-helix domain-containing protein [Pirellulales bacterium]
MSHLSPDKSPPRWLLRRLDQVAIAGLSLFALAAMGAFWLAHSGHRGRLIEIDRADPLKIEFLVDVNQADWPEITTLPDVGETLAKRIVDDRRQRGPFASIDDLQRVRGIGPKTFERMRPYVRTITPESAVVRK